MIPSASEPHSNDPEDPDEYDEPEELAAEPPVSSEFAKTSPGLSYTARRAITIFVMLALLGVVGYFAWSRWPISAPGEIPTITAATDVKQKPEQPGGIDIPNQNVQVYKEIDNGNADQQPSVEHLLPPPETPAAAPSAPPASKSASSNAAPLQVPQMESLLAQPSKVETTASQEPVATASGILPVTSAPATAVAPAPVAAPVPAPTPAPKAKAVASVAVMDMTKPAPAGKKNVAVQLASTPDHDNAHHMVEALEKKYAAQLGSAKLHIVKADLGTRGVFYRIQGPLMTKAQAESICSDLKRLKAGCLLVHP